MLAEPIQQHLEQHSHLAALGIPDSRRICGVQHRNHRLPLKGLSYYLDHQSRNTSLANICYPKCFQVHYSRHFEHGDS
jgi:hypothetical protein